MANEHRAKDSSFFGIINTLNYLSILKMSSAHTENLPADLNEHNEELADGCDNADTYLSAFYLCSFSFSLFSAFVMMRSEFLRKRRKEILVIIIVEIDDSLSLG